MVVLKIKLTLNKINVQYSLMPRKAVKPVSDKRAATEKRARTRQLVLRAALECIGEKGVAGATASEIARRCGLSWGVIQYHFGDRVGLFLGLLESSGESLAEALADLDAADREPGERVRAIVEGMWSLMKHDNFRVMLEVQLQLGREAQHRSRVRKQTRAMRTKLQELWRKALPEFPSARVDTAERIATMGLRGLALERAVDGDRAVHRADRAALVRSAVAALTEDGV